MRRQRQIEHVQHAKDCMQKCQRTLWYRHCTLYTVHCVQCERQRDIEPQSELLYHLLIVVNSHDRCWVCLPFIVHGCALARALHFMRLLNRMRCVCVRRCEDHLPHFTGENDSDRHTFTYAWYCFYECYCGDGIVARVFWNVLFADAWWNEYRPLSRIDLIISLFAVVVDCCRSILLECITWPIVLVICECGESISWCFQLTIH